MAALPEQPKNTEFEDFVSAFLQSSGFHVEKSLIQREGGEVLELDIISTKYRKNRPPAERLIEVKSGGWGFPEIFKISGWGKYLSLEDLCLVVCKEKPNKEFFQEKCAEIGVRLIHHPNNLEALASSELLERANSDEADVNLWRFSHWLERKILEKIKLQKKNNLHLKGYIALDKYFHAINSDIFFAKNVSERVIKLYRTFQEYPNISKKLTNELAGHEFDEEHERIPNAVFEATYYQSKFTDLTLTTYVEHRARIAILKSAVDFELFSSNGNVSRAPMNLNLGGYEIPYRTMLPETFINGLQEIREDPYFHAYPVFWQHFIWFFGGFILSDRIEDEYKLFSLKTGIPPNEIPNALNAYQKLFPISGGWFTPPSGNSRISKIKMMCSPFQGIGANVRRHYYTDDDSFNSLNLAGWYTNSDLLSWNNLAAGILDNNPDVAA